MPLNLLESICQSKNACLQPALILSVSLNKSVHLHSYKVFDSSYIEYLLGDHKQNIFIFQLPCPSPSGPWILM